MQNNALRWIGSVCILLILVLVHLQSGKSFVGSWNALWDFDPNNMNHVLFREVQFPRTIIALFAGMALSLSGLLMQTLFNNPLAGPSVLGISSGSSLFVALAILTGIPFFSEDFSLVSAAIFGALVFSFIILLFAWRIPNSVTLLLVGMMLSSFTSAIIQLIQTITHADRLKAFTLWGFGSLQQINFQQLPLLLCICVFSLVASIFLIKPLNALILGEQQAKNLGFSIGRIRIAIILVSSILTGIITAYCGPITFIGLAVPNLVKILFKTKLHAPLFLGSMMIGAMLLVFCDLLVLWLEDWVQVPLNSVTALFGAPFVVWILVKRLT